MKNLLIAFAATAITMIYDAPVFAKSWEGVSKEKKVHNQYKVMEGDKLVIDNIYGKVHVNTWDKNEITVDIVVTTKARTDAEAQEILDRIDFVMSSDQESGHKVYCRTVLAASKHNTQSSSMTIDYTINAPKKNAIDITNKYGDVYLGDFSGKMRMNVSYGAVDLQTITGGDKRIKVAFGSLMAGSIESGTLEVSYSDVMIDKALDLDISNKFGKLEIEDIQTLKIGQQYGSAEVGSVSQVTGTVDYADIVIGNLDKSAELTVKYSGKTEIKSIGAGVEEINMDAYYSNLFYHFGEGANLALDVATSYSTVKKGMFAKTLELTNLDRSSTNSDHYKGKVGKGDGSMVVNTHYSNVNFK